MRRVLSLLVVVVLVTTGCASRKADRTVATPRVPAGPGAAGTERPAALGGSTPSPGAAATGGPGVRRTPGPDATSAPSTPKPNNHITKPPPAPTGTPPPQATPSDDAALGSNAFFFLNRRVGKLVIEIDRVSGWEPSQEAVDLLVQRLRSVCDKPDGIQVLPFGTVQGRSHWSFDDVQKAEEATRDAHNSSEQAVIHLLYLDGTSDEGALGVAFSSSGAAIFIEDIRDNALPTVPAVAVEKADVVHETGHLLSLVNIGYTSPRDHEDPDNKGHSKNINSVMYAAIDNVGVFTVFRGLNRLPPTDFDSDDRADLADVKSGKLG